MSAESAEERVEDLIACAEREVRMRERVYPRWVADGRMSQAKADAEIRMMGDIVETLKAMATAQPEPQGSLFT